MKKIAIRIFLVLIGVLTTVGMAKAGYYDYGSSYYPYYDGYGSGYSSDYYPYYGSYDYGYYPSSYGSSYYPYGYGYENNYGSSYPYYDYDYSSQYPSSYDYGDYYYPYNNYSYPYDSSGWYNDYFADNYNNYYNNGWDYNYIPYNNDYHWDNFNSYGNYDYGWDNNYGPMYVWNKNESNPTFKLNNYQNYFAGNNLYNYYPRVKQKNPSKVIIKKIEIIQKEETRKNIIIDNCNVRDYDIPQARIVVSRTTFIKIQETILKDGDISLDISPDHRVEFYSPHGNFSEANAAVYFGR